MMSMSMSMEYRQVLRCEDPFSAIFKETSMLLTTKSIYVKALEFIGRNKNRDKYNDIIDFLFCEIFENWKYDCQKFYKGKGAKLSEHYSMTQKQIDNIDAFFVNQVLPKAVEIYSDKNLIRWSDFQRSFNTEENRHKLNQF